MGLLVAIGSVYSVALAKEGFQGDPLGFTGTLIALLTLLALVAFQPASKCSLKPGRLRRLRILCFSLSPGLLGIVAAFLHSQFLGTMIAAWMVASLLFGIRIAYEYEHYDEFPFVALGSVMFALIAWIPLNIIFGSSLILLALELAFVFFVLRRPILSWLSYMTKGNRYDPDKGLLKQISRHLQNLEQLWDTKGPDLTLREVWTAFQSGPADTKSPLPPKLLPVEATPPKDKPTPPPVPTPPADKPEADAATQPKVITVPSQTSKPITATEPTPDAPATDSEATAEPTAEPSAPQSGSEASKAPAPPTEAASDEEPAKKDPEPTPVTSAPPAPAPVPETVALRDLLKDVFNEALSGYQSGQKFKENYAGKQAVWPGKIITSEEFTYDTVFGAGGGLRVILEVGEIQTSYGGLPVEAVLKLPATQADTIEALHGQAAMGSGTMVEVDPFMRRVYLEGGGIKGE